MNTKPQRLVIEESVVPVDEMVGQLEQIMRVRKIRVDRLQRACVAAQKAAEEAAQTATLKAEAFTTGRDANQAQEQAALDKLIKQTVATKEVSYFREDVAQWRADTQALQDASKAADQAREEAREALEAQRQQVKDAEKAVEKIRYATDARRAGNF